MNGLTHRIAFGKSWRKENLAKEMPAGEGEPISPHSI
jgi:hypothetical protein